ncbi:UNVERIFIED_CONTAM: hypothetical protein Slati_2109300 [Sesamum latifolium]|uniref:Reverse transcriptase domain-containing protein n=1 Tax=Sesamum latifolium TaxID=2727402 RepID=A0AAW2WT40_9LAMI
MHSYQQDSITARIESCRIGLLNWSKKEFGNVSSRINKLEKRIQDLRKGMITTNSKAEEMKIRMELDGLKQDEECMWKQRSRVDWLRNGDKNTSFFHARASKRKLINEILRIKDGHGQWREKEEDMQEVLLNYFSKLFESSKSNTQHIDKILECVGRRVNDEMNESLNQPYTAEEIKTALNQMRPDKSPGPDGMPALFYQNFWRIVGPTTINSILFFLNNGIFPLELNHTYIVLIPKCKKPEHVSQFRPISLCNVIYKIASRVLANRLKPMLDSIISENQSAFIPGRYITDNVLIAFEVNHYFRNKRKGKEGVATLKLDMSKAYDRVKWAFL